MLEERATLCEGILIGVSSCVVVVCRFEQICGSLVVVLGLSQGALWPGGPSLVFMQPFNVQHKICATCGIRWIWNTAKKNLPSRFVYSVYTALERCSDCL